MVNSTHVLKCSVNFQLNSPLALFSGESGEITDSTIESVINSNGERLLHINGYVWASLLRRAANRIGSSLNTNDALGGSQENGVAGLWCNSSFIPMPETIIRPGIKIDRAYGSTEEGGLYNDEMVPAGLHINLDFNYFYNNENEPKDMFTELFKLIDFGIVNIGGNWSYGMGRLKVIQVKYKKLDLKNKTNLSYLWKFNGIKWDETLSADVFSNRNARELSSYKCYKIDVNAAIADGQIFAIHSDAPYEGLDYNYDKLPDDFVYRTPKLIKNGTNQYSAEFKPTITGKALRQALFSATIERKMNSGKLRGTIQDYFGDMKKGGLISIKDSFVQDYDTEVLNRIQLCEHSMQNLNLFAAEYLTRGHFNFEILIDALNDDNNAKALYNHVKKLLEEINQDAPPGWYRIGADSTGAGQIKIKDWEVRECLV